MPGVSKRDGKYRGFVRLVGFQSESKTFDTRKEALAWAAEREKELQRRRLACPDLLIDEVVAQYLKHVEPKRRMAPSHRKHDIPSFRRRLNGLKLSDLFGTGLTDWILDQGDVSPGTRNWHVCRLYGVLRQAEIHLKIQVPWDDMDACRRKMSDMGHLTTAGVRERRVSDAEIAAIKRHLCRQVSVRMADIIDFAVQSCMRVGEVCRLRWDDLNKIDRTILVRDRKHPTRKYGNHQVVPLLCGSFETLTRQPVRGDLIFPHDPTNISLKFRRAADAADVRDVVFHDLRHEGISRMFELGFQVQEVALVSGHTNWKTLARYLHLRPQSLVHRERQLRQKESPRRRPDGERIGATGGRRPRGAQTPYPTPMVTDAGLTG